MKKLLVVLLPLAINFGAYAATDTRALANKVNAYISMEQKHHSGWFDYAKQFNDAKMDLKKKHINEKMEVVKNNIAKLGKGVPAEQYLQEQLDEMIALHKTHMKEWMKFHETQDTKVRDLAQKEKAELEAYENKYQE